MFSTKKVLSLLTLLTLSLFSFGLYFSISSPKVYAANGTARITNNATLTTSTQVRDVSESAPGTPITENFPIARVFACVNNQALGVINSGSSVDFSGASGTYNLTLIDITFEDIGAVELQCATLNTNPITHPIISRTQFTLSDDCTTNVQINGQAQNNGTFPAFSAPQIISSTPTPNIARLRVLNPAEGNTPYRFLCVDGMPYFGDIDGNFNFPNPTTQLAIEVSAVNLPSFNCTGQNINPTTLINLLPNTTITLGTVLLTELSPNYSLTGISTAAANPTSCPVSSSSMTSTSSMMSSSSISKTTPKKVLVRTGGSDN
jgi:hypothetical protein